MDENKTLDPELMEALKGVWNSLTDEQREKAMACKTTEELTALAAKESIELSDELLDAVAGGYIFKYVIKGDCYIRTEYQVIKDKNGRVLKRFNNMEDAKAQAKKWKQSTDEIDWNRVEELRANDQSCF